LPSAGSYTLVAFSDGTAEGVSYAFRMEETGFTSLVLGVPATGTLLGDRQAFLFRVALQDSSMLQLTARNGGSGNRLEMYAQLGFPPHRSSYDYADFSGPGANRDLLIPSAAPGVWHILVYADTVGTPGSFTIEADVPAVALSGITPSRNPTDAVAALTLTGAGFQRPARLGGCRSTFSDFSSHGISPTQRSKWRFGTGPRMIPP
jgi:hypothetical protein